MPLLNRVISAAVLFSFQANLLAMMLLERIPDQVVVRDSDFSLNVESYFSEPVLEFRVHSPDFLSFSSRKLAPCDLAQLPLQGIQGVLRAAVGQGQDVFITTKEFGLLIYHIQPDSAPELLQHYFSPSICHHFQHLSAVSSLIALYNSSYVSVLDISERLFPMLLSESGFEAEIVKVLTLENGELLVVTRQNGVQMYQYGPETGLTVNKTLQLGDNFHPTDAAIASNTLYTIDPEHGLRSFSLDTGRIRSLNVTGQQLFLTNTTLIVDNSTVLDLQTLNVTTYLTPRSTDLFAVAGDVYFFGNSTHLLAFNPVLNLSSIEERNDLTDLAVVNETLLEIRERGAALRNFAPESAVLHGHTPAETGGFEVRFTARGKANSVEAHFMLMVEAPPFEVLIYLLGGSSCVLLLAGLGCFLFKLASERKQQPSVPGMHILSDEFSSATNLPHPRELGPMPEPN